MAGRNPRAKAPKRPTHTCAHCWTRIAADAIECPKCSFVFDGAGGYDRLDAERPSALFVRLFRPDEAA